MKKTTDELLAERDEMVMLANGGAVARVNQINGMLIERGVLDEQCNPIVMPRLVDADELAG